MKCGRQTGENRFLKPHESRYPDTAQWHYQGIFKNREAHFDDKEMVMEKSPENAVAAGASAVPHQ